MARQEVISRSRTVNQFLYKLQNIHSAWDGHVGDNGAIDNVTVIYAVIDVMITVVTSLNIM